MGCCKSKVDNEEDAEAKNNGQVAVDFPNPHETGVRYTMGEVAKDIRWMACGCHSWYCGIIFVLFWIVALYVVNIGRTQGEIQRLYRGFDSMGNVCGVQTAKQLDGASPKLDHTESKQLYYIFMNPAAFTQPKIEPPGMLKNFDWRPYVWDPSKEGDERKVAIDTFAICVGPTNYKGYDGKVSCPRYETHGRDYYIDMAKYRAGDTEFIVPQAECSGSQVSIKDMYSVSKQVNMSNDNCFRIANTKTFLQFCQPEEYNNGTITYYCQQNESAAFTEVDSPDDCDGLMRSVDNKISTKSDREQGQLLDTAFAGQQSGIQALILSVMADTSKAASVFAVAAIFAFLMGITWLIILRMFAGCIVWTAIICTIIGTAYAGYYMYNESQTNTSLSDTRQQAYLYISYALFLGTVVEIAVVIFLRRAIMLAIAVVRLATGAMRDMPLLMFFPIIPYLFFGICCLYFVYGMLLLCSAGTLEFVGGMRYFTFDDDLRKMMWYHLFVFLWTSNFIMDVGSCTIGMAAALWYFTPFAKIAHKDDDDGTLASEVYVRPPLRPAYRMIDNGKAMEMKSGNVRRTNDVASTSSSPSMKAVITEPIKVPLKGKKSNMDGEEGVDYKVIQPDDEEGWYETQWFGFFSCCCGDTMTPYAYWLILRYFLGVALCGSFIVAVVQLIRAIVMYVQSQLEDYKDNRIVKLIFCLINCCLWCVEKCMKYITKNSYIQAVIWDLGFFQACLSSFQFIFRNLGRMAAMGYVANALVLLGQGFVVILTMCLSITLLNALVMQRTINGMVLPCIICFFISYFVAYVFLSVYQMVMDTLLQCVVSDEEIAKGKSGAEARTAFTNAELAGLLDRATKEAAINEAKKGKKEEEAAEGAGKGGVEDAGAE